MPCTKCEEGKYKWGETGECKYDTLDACESANHKYSKMKPTPLGKKTYEEYAKELKEFNLSKVERVELNLVNDFDSAWAAGFRFIEKANKELDEVKKTFTAGIKEFENSLDASAKFEKAAKELGIDVPKEITAKTKEAKGYIKEAKAKI